MISVIKGKKPLKNPITVFSRCPSCGAKNLLKVDVDVICTVCAWNSMSAHVDSGGLDCLISAYEEGVEKALEKMRRKFMSNPAKSFDGPFVANLC